MSVVAGCGRCVGWCGRLRMLWHAWFVGWGWILWFGWWFPGLCMSGYAWCVGFGRILWFEAVVSGFVHARAYAPRLMCLISLAE